MKKVHCPILSVPGSFSFKYTNDILFPSDYKVSYTKDALLPITEITNLNEAVAHCFHISNEPELSEKQKKNRDNIDDYFVNITHDFMEVADASIPEAITKYIQDEKIGLLAMTRRKHSFLEKLLFKQNISVIGMHLEIPFLVIPIKRRNHDYR